MSIYRGDGGAGDVNNSVTINEIETLRSEAAQSATEAEDSAAAALVSEGLADADATQTALDKIATNADAAQVALDLIATNQDTLDTAADLVQTNQDTLDTAADLVQTNLDRIQTTADAASALASKNAAATSATNASNSATAAATSATAASSSESNAASSASAASSSASSAASSATSAAQSAASAATLLDNFDDRYLGAKASDPSVDNDGDPLVIGALYFNSTDGVMKTYTASGWLAASSASVATMAKFKFTATAGQTVFTGADDGGDTLSMTVGSEIVTLNGIVLESGTDYTPASGSITLATGATAGDELNVFAFGNFTVADTVSASLGGTFSGPVTFSDAFTSRGIDDNATSTAVTLDSLGNVGIGTSSPNNKLHVKANATDNRIAIETQNTSGNASIEAQASDYWTQPNYRGTSIVQYDRTASGTTCGVSNASMGHLRFQNGNGGLIYTNGPAPIVMATTGTERMRIDASGNVGIGTSSPAAPLQINDASTTSVGSTAGDYTENLRIYGNSGNTSQLSQYTVRDANGTDWTSSGTRLQMKIDLTYMGWMQFNGDGNNGGVSFGAGLSNPTPTGVPERMRIDSAGRVTMPYQPAFAVGRSGDYTPSADSACLFNTTSIGGGHNTGNHYNTSTGKFTAPVSGVYSFTAIIIYISVPNGAALNDSFRFAINGGGTQYSWRRAEYVEGYTGNASFYTDFGSTQVYLNANDTVEVRLRLTTSIHGNSEYTTFRGHLIG